MSVNTNTILRWDILRNLLPFDSLTGKKALDVGAGLGFFSVQLQRLGAKVTAVDVDEKALNYLRQNYGISTEVMDVEKASFAGGPFDLIFIGEILEHVSQPRSLLAKARSTLAPGGRIILSTPALEGVFIHSQGKRLCHHEGSERHKRDGFSYDELLGYLSDLDLKLVGHRYCLFFFSELFMQLTKIGYIFSKPSYHSQYNVVEISSGLKFKLLQTLFPLLHPLFRAEQKVSEFLGLQGHCHVMMAESG